MQYYDVCRKLDRKSKEVVTLNMKFQRKEKQSIHSSYGLRLLKTCTVSGSRNNALEIDSSSIQDIPDSCISKVLDSKIGEGRFGSCTLARFHEYTVCVKTLDKQHNLQQLLREAYFLHKAGSHRCIPHLFGVIKSSNAIVMSYHSIEGSALSLYEAYCQDKLICNTQWVKHITTAAETILHLHNHNIIHNDLKMDNFVLGTSSNMEVQPVLVDFGKACFLGQGKTYKLTVAEKEEYRIRHAHIAPDVRDGIIEQTFSSDVFSFGYMMYTLAKKKDIGHRMQLVSLSKECMLYSATDRPEMPDIVQSLTEIIAS